MRRKWINDTAVSLRLLALAAVLLLCACSSQARWQEQYDLGMRYLTESNYEEAILAFTEAIRINPEHADTYVYLIQGYLSTGDVEQAEQVRLQGYEATGDGRLSQSVLDGRIFYDDAIPFEEKVFYRSFELLSQEQQEKMRQMAETLKAENVEETLTFLSGGLPPLLCTYVDGWQVEILCIQGDSLEAYHQSWMENEGRALTEKVSTASYEDTAILDGQLQQVRLTPENGTGYTCFYEELTQDLSTEELPEFIITTAFRGIKKNECKNWIEDGAVTARTEWGSVHFDGEESFGSMMQIESTGTVIDGTAVTEMTRVIQEYEDGTKEVREYDQNGQTSWYMEGPDGERQDMQELMSAIMDFVEDLSTNGVESLLPEAYW